MNFPSQNKASEPSHSLERPHPLAMTNPRTSRHAFTLVEVVVVTAIIATLVVLTLPAINGMAGRADSVKCVSNLKQIGAGMALHVIDHDGRLPGPLSGAQYAMYGTYNPSSGRLSQHLQGYISPDVPVGGGVMLSPLFVCPGFARVVKIDTSAQPYITNGDVNGIAAFGKNPGGDPNDPNPSKRPQPGATIAILSGGTTSLCNIWAMQDLDQDWTVPFGKAPLHPVHPTYKAVTHSAGATNVMKAHPGAYRNALFFDFHVGPLALDGTVK
jgi:prepilin-type N-terminal cleavage/methylation domain-containing protein/prepilin-type processing-associated H-X9-DG protein